MKHIDTIITGSRIVKEIKFQNENGNIIVAEKWTSYSDYADDSDMNIIEGKEYWDKLSDEEQDELLEIINEEFHNE
jgi:hypothetical protein